MAGSDSLVVRLRCVGTDEVFLRPSLSTTGLVPSLCRFELGFISSCEETSLLTSTRDGAEEEEGDNDVVLTRTDLLPGLVVATFLCCVVLTTTLESSLAVWEEEEGLFLLESLMIRLEAGMWVLVEVGVCAETLVMVVDGTEGL